MHRSHCLALGVWLASRGGIVAVGFAISALGALASIGALVAFGAGQGHGATRVPALTAQLVAWGSGVTIAFGGALHAARRDRDEGVTALLRARGVTAAAYVRGRVGGLAIVVAAAVAGPTLVAALAATSFARPVLPVVRASLGALAYALAFAATIAPVAMATLGARTRAGGYLALVSVLVVPELLSPWTGALLPRGWTELTSIPAALSAVGAGFTSPAAAAHLARALAGLGAIVAASLLVVAVRLPRIDARGRA
jgi:hypothetical protein